MLVRSLKEDADLVVRLVDKNGTLFAREMFKMYQHSQHSPEIVGSGFQETGIAHKLQTRLKGAKMLKYVAHNMSVMYSGS
jgi:hypothetical protein